MSKPASSPLAGDGVTGAHTEASFSADGNGNGISDDRRKKRRVSEKGLSTTPEIRRSRSSTMLQRLAKSRGSDSSQRIYPTMDSAQSRRRLSSNAVYYNPHTQQYQAHPDLGISKAGVRLNRYGSVVSPGHSPSKSFSSYAHARAHADAHESSTNAMALYPSNSFESSFAARAFGGGALSSMSYVSSRISHTPPVPAPVQVKKIVHMAFRVRMMMATCVCFSILNLTVQYFNIEYSITHRYQSMLDVPPPEYVVIDFVYPIVQYILNIFFLFSYRKFNSVPGQISGQESGGRQGGHGDEDGGEGKFDLDFGRGNDAAAGDAYALHEGGDDTDGDEEAQTAKRERESCGGAGGTERRVAAVIDSAHASQKRMRFVK